MRAPGWPRRVGQDLAEQVARGLYHLDGLRPAARRRRRSATGISLDTEPQAVLTVVSHWRSGPQGERLACLKRCVDGLLDLDVDHVMVVVLTNAPEATARTLSEHVHGRDVPVPVRVAADALDGNSAAPREVVAVRWRPRLWHRSGFYLPWGHVEVFRRAARTGRFSHLLYLEDDIGFTDQHLRYWCRYRGPLAALGLVPGFVRFEWHEAERYLVDQPAPLDPAVRRRTVTADDPGVCREVVNLANPYQALYVLDGPLIDEYLSRPRSALRSRAIPIPLGVRERAASGPLFDDVPPGLLSRNVVPVRTRDGAPQLDPCCLIEHMAATYARNPDSAYAAVRVEDLFTGG